MALQIEQAVDDGMDTQESLVLDGVYANDRGKLRFQPLPALRRP